MLLKVLSCLEVLVRADLRSLQSLKDRQGLLLDGLSQLLKELNVVVLA